MSDKDELTLEAIERNPWNAVYLPLPDAPSPKVVEQAHWVAEQCYEAALNRAEQPNWPGRSVFEPGEWPMKDNASPETAAALALTRLEQLEAMNPTLTRSGPHSLDPKAVERGDALAAQIMGAAGEQVQQPQQVERNPMSDDHKPVEQFQAAGRLTTKTPQDQRERDLAEVVQQRVELAGERDKLAHITFKRTQAELGEQISREADPARRQELRNEREAQGHGFVAGLSEHIGRGLDAAGQHDAASAMKREAELRREIAAEIRGSGKGGPDKPEGPAKGDGRTEFAAAAREAAQEAGLGQSARTIHVETRTSDDIRSKAGGKDYRDLKQPEQEPQPDGVLARLHAQLRQHIKPEIVNDMGRQTVTAVHNNREATPRQDGLRQPDTTTTRTAETVRRSEQASRDQQQERQAVVHGAATAATPSAETAMQRHMAKMDRIRSSLEKGEDKSAVHEAARPAFRSFGGRG